MGKKLKFAMIALLGFSTACSSVKKTEKSREAEKPSEEVAPTIHVMYGVRTPEPEKRRIKMMDGKGVSEAAENAPAIEKSEETK